MLRLRSKVRLQSGRQAVVEATSASTARGRRHQQLASAVAYFDQLFLHQPINGVTDGFSTLAGTGFKLPVCQPIPHFAGACCLVVPSDRLANDDGEQMPFAAFKCW